jgi:GDP-L-fucose synthase
MINKSDKIYIAGHRGMVGSACWRALEAEGYTSLIGKTSKELDLRNQKAVEDFIRAEKPVVIIDAAAKVGGILANDTYPYEFLMDNMLIQNNLIRSAHENDVPKFIFLGSSCIYPKFAPQPLKEEYLLTDSLEPTNEWYAIAKISGVKLIESLRKEYNRDYVSLMPTNLYGPNDNFDLKSSHVLPAMIRKFHEAKVNDDANVELWGSGAPKREFLYVDDLAQAVLFAIDNILDEHLYNVGTGIDLTIKELASLVQSIVGHNGEITWDSSKPDGTPRKLMDNSRLMNQGWIPNIDLESGIRYTYNDFLNSLVK